MRRPAAPKPGQVGTVTELVGDGEARVVLRARSEHRLSQVQVRLTELETVRWTLPRWWWARGRFFQAVAPVAAGWCIGILLAWLFFGGDRELTDLAITGAVILGVPLVVLGVIEVRRTKTNRG